MSTIPFLPVTYTPGSDLATSSKPNQVIWARTGNDIVLAYQPLDANVGHLPN